MMNLHLTPSFSEEVRGSNHRYNCLSYAQQFVLKHCVSLASHDFLLTPIYLDEMGVCNTELVKVTISFEKKEVNAEQAQRYMTTLPR
ncbi:hypothetical protein [Mechercharimyces sp. CAU 1602]|uniref:hypothetical protein n=1 Tax=Mechercharimyces sp. CAU 1602 TaxID=2973933 RepID=UPI00216121EA|nr:hypothetical protein [Mechercharimyces sp. CAU 1602]MCS1352231.1 hypothetical protein [Mechercharimyces sp. CAU 1602]